MSKTGSTQAAVQCIPNPNLKRDLLVLQCSVFLTLTLNGVYRGLRDGSTQVAVQCNPNPKRGLLRLQCSVFLTLHRVYSGCSALRKMFSVHIYLPINISH